MKDEAERGDIDAGLGAMLLRTKLELVNYVHGRRS